MKYHIFLGCLAVVTGYPGVIQQEQLEPKYDFGPISESGHHHQIDHEFAKSHQSIKFEHFHPVPVYVKKEHSQLLQHPLEKGKSESNLKIVHPETEHKHGGGLVLEDSRHNSDHLSAIVSHVGYEHGAFGHGDEYSSGFEGYAGPESLKGYVEISNQHETDGHYVGEAAQGLFDAGEGFNKYDNSY